MTAKTMPPLPTGSVDLSALHAAEARGTDLNKAIEAATTRVEPPKPAAAAPAKQVKAADPA